MSPMFSAMGRAAGSASALGLSIPHYGWALGAIVGGLAFLKSL